MWCAAQKFLLFFARFAAGRFPKLCAEAHGDDARYRVPRHGVLCGVSGQYGVPKAAAGEQEAGGLIRCPYQCSFPVSELFILRVIAS